MIKNFKIQLVKGLLPEEWTATLETGKYNISDLNHIEFTSDESKVISHTGYLSYYFNQNLTEYMELSELILDIVKNLLRDKDKINYDIFVEEMEGEKVT